MQSPSSRSPTTNGTLEMYITTFFEIRRPIQIKEASFFFDPPLVVEVHYLNIIIFIVAPLKALLMSSLRAFSLKIAYA